MKQIVEALTKIFTEAGTVAGLALAGYLLAPKAQRN